MLVLVGSSSTGKTRACWEAVRPLADQGWRLWHPFDPTRADAALADLEHVGPRTVVWLNEAQHYLGHAQAGEPIAAALHTLLTQPHRGPVLVLGTLWPAYSEQYTALPLPGAADPHSRVRELLTGRTLTIPDAFNTEELRTATCLAQAGDLLLADALTRSGSHGRVTQDLAGAPELLRRYDQAAPPSRALLEVAMDARRLGVGINLCQSFLTDAAIDYLTDHEYDQLSDDWAEAALADLARLVHGKQAPLRRTNPRPPRSAPGVPAARAGLPGRPVFRLADYLEQHGRTTRGRLCPPASFWAAAHAHLSAPEDLNNLAEAAHYRHRLQWAHHLRRSAAVAGSGLALTSLAAARRLAGDREGAEALYRQAADSGNPGALYALVEMLEEAGERTAAVAVATLAADNGRPRALFTLAQRSQHADRFREAVLLYRQAARAGSAQAMTALGRTHEWLGEYERAEALYRKASDNGFPGALVSLGRMREKWDPQQAEALYRQAADIGHSGGLVALAIKREKAGDCEGAEEVARQAAESGHLDVLVCLADLRLRLGSGDREGAESLVRQAADKGSIEAMIFLARLRKTSGDHKQSEVLYRQAAENGHSYAMVSLAQMLEELGDGEKAEAVARQAASRGNPNALLVLAEARKAHGPAAATSLAREATDAGAGIGLNDEWPHGLDPDGSPTPPWNAEDAEF
ncbi:hypothetical protein ACWCQL_33395 [Streptomyces sp. NPDC002073]